MASSHLRIVVALVTMALLLGVFLVVQFIRLRQARRDGGGGGSEAETRAAGLGNTAGACGAGSVFYRGACVDLFSKCDNAADPNATYVIKAKSPTTGPHEQPEEVLGTCAFHRCDPYHVRYMGKCEPLGQGKCAGDDPHATYTLRAYGSGGGGVCVSRCKDGYAQFGTKCVALGTNCTPTNEEVDPNATYGVQQQSEMLGARCHKECKSHDAQNRPLVATASGQCIAVGSVCAGSDAFATYRIGSDGTCAKTGCRNPQGITGGFASSVVGNCIRIEDECDTGMGAMTSMGSWGSNSQGVCQIWHCPSGFVWYGNECLPIGSECQVEEADEDEEGEVGDDQGHSGNPTTRGYTIKSRSDDGRLGACVPA